MNAPQKLALQIKLPTADRRMEPYALSAPRDFPAQQTQAFNRVAFAAAHVVPDPLATKDPWLEAAVDWERTIAWGEGGYYCRLFLNVAGREPEGTVAADDYERVRTELKEKLEALGDERGRPIGTVAHRPEELYEVRNGIVPDLMVYFGDLYWRSIGQVGTDTVHVFENDTGPDDANHAHEGLYVLVAEGVEAGRSEERSLLDIAPTLLALLGEPLPPEMEGESLV